MAIKRGLGKGLGVNALIPDMQNEAAARDTQTLPLNDIEPNREQPRKTFDKEKLEVLSESIKAHGMVQPIIVTKEDGYFRIVAGERRWRAAKMLGLKEVPVVVRSYSPLEAEEVALIENLQREDLNPIEEAAGYKQLMDKFSLTQEQVSQKVGKSRPSVANALRLFLLPEKIQEMLKKGEISTGHAKALLSFENKKDMEKAAEDIVKYGLSVRLVEAMAHKKPNKPEKKKPTDKNVENAIKDACTTLERRLGTKVKISCNTAYKGKLEIAFKDLKQMTAILEEIKK